MEERKEKNLYLQTATLITPPKDPNEQPRIVATPVPNPTPSIVNSLEPLCRREEEPFTPIKTADECGDDFEPLPFRVNGIEPSPFNDNIFERSLSPNNTLNNHLWQLVYSPLQATARSDRRQTENEDGEQKKHGGDFKHPPPVNNLLIPEKTGSKNDDPEEDNNKLQFPSKREIDKLLPYPHHPWQMHPPPPHYWYPHYHYGYQHHHHYGSPGGQGRLPHPILYPNPQYNGHNHLAYRSSLQYGHFRKHPFMDSHHHPANHQEYITDVTHNDVICGRGGAVNNHPGNRRFRQFIQEFKHKYLHETKQKKPFVAMRVLEAVKNSNPPGRFLVKYPGGYLECGDDRAREKASQALREGAAKLRKQGYGVKSGKGDKSGEETKRGLEVKNILLPTERTVGENYWDDAKYSSDFEPPPKKVKQEEI